MDINNLWKWDLVVQDCSRAIKIVDLMSCTIKKQKYENG